MKVEKAIEILQNERACVDTDACDHSCDDCMLSGNKDEILEALDMAMDALKITRWGKTHG